MFDTLTLSELVALDTELWRAQRPEGRQHEKPQPNPAVVAEIGELRQDINAAMFNRADFLARQS